MPTERFEEDSPMRKRAVLTAVALAIAVGLGLTIDEVAAAQSRRATRSC